MENLSKTAISLETLVNASPDKVWQYWTEPQHITQWNAASPDWHSPSAQNDLREGGKFSIRMEAKDGSIGFDFGGVYDKVIPQKFISYTLGDGRRVEIKFSEENGATRINEVFEAEDQNEIELQRYGWQAILDNFKQYTESSIQS